MRKNHDAICQLSAFPISAFQRSAFFILKFQLCAFNFQLFFSQHPSTPVARNPAQKNPSRRQSRPSSRGSLTPVAAPNASPNVFLAGVRMRRSGFVLADEDVSAKNASVGSLHQSNDGRRRRFRCSAYSVAWAIVPNPWPSGDPNPPYPATRKNHRPRHSPALARPHQSRLGRRPPPNARIAKALSAQWRPSPARKPSDSSSVSTPSGRDSSTSPHRPMPHSTSILSSRSTRPKAPHSRPTGQMTAARKILAPRSQPLLSLHQKTRSASLPFSPPSPQTPTHPTSPCPTPLSPAPIPESKFL